MRTAVVPAQITTVEDKLIGNLNIIQVVLIVIPLAISIIIFTLFPSRMSLTFYKIPLILVTFFSFSIFALRFRGKIILDWCIILAKYNLRPKYYIYDKNTIYLRDIYIKPEEELATNKAKFEAENKSKTPIRKLQFADLIKKEEQLLKQKVSFTFKNNKGGAYVVVEQS